MNWPIWWQWVVDHQVRIMFIPFLIFGLSHAFFTPFAGRKLYKQSKVSEFLLIRHVSYLLLALAVDPFCSLIANIDPARVFNGKISYSWWFTIWMWSGKAYIWYRALRLSWYIFDPFGVKK